MVLISGGIFKMGDVDNIYSPIFKPKISPTLVELNSFHLCNHVVTRLEWAAVMGTPCKEEEAFLPQTHITWHDVHEFISKLNQELKWNFRLPTEAEWEYAARGGEFNNAQNYSGGETLDLVGWYSFNSHSELHPVKQKKANLLGLYDMSGNIWEWCSDLYKSEYPKEYKPQGVLDRIRSGKVLIPIKNPTGAKIGNKRVLRGGAYDCADYKSWVFYRNWENSTYKSNNIGFRLAY